MRTAWIGGLQDGTPDGAEAALDPRRPARPAAPLHRHVERRRVRVDRRRRDAGTPLNKGSRGGLPARSRRRVRPRPALRAHLARSTPDGLYQQNHCGIYRMRPRRGTAGCASARRCRSRSATSASRSSCTRAIRGHAWVFPMDGTERLAAHEPRRQAGRRTSRANARRDAGSAWTRACPPKALVDGEAPGDVRGRARSGRALLRHDERRGLGEPRRGRALDAASPRHLPHIYAVEAGETRERRPASPPRSAPTPASARRSRRTARRSPSSSPTSTAATRASASGSSTSRTGSGRTSRSSSTASRCGGSMRRSPRRTK